MRSCTGPLAIPTLQLKKTALAKVVHAGVAEEIQNLLGAEAIEHLDFEAVETALRHHALQITARALEQRFNRDTSDDWGPPCPCVCGQMARYVDRRSKGPRKNNFALCSQTIPTDLIS